MKRNVLSVLLGLAMLLTLCVGASAATTLPSGYTAVDCVRSVGEGAIDTEYATADATTSYSYEIKFAYESATITGANQTMLGVSAGTARSGLLIARTSGNGGGTAIIFGTDQATSAYSPVTYTNTANETTIRVDIDIAANTYDITKDGQALATDKAINGSPKSASTVFAFANHSSSTSQNFNTPATGSIYYLKMWQDGTLVRDFVPAKDSSGVYGLYDLVKGKFHTDVKNSANILGPKEIVWGAYDIYFTAPSDMTLTIGKGFSDSGEIQPRYASSTEDGVTTHHYKLDAGNYRFMTSGEEYYRLHKNFVVTAAKNGTTINANPGKQTGKGWEQSNSCPWPIYQFADEVINSDAYKLKDSVYTNYPDAFSGPTFTNTSKTAYEFTSDPEILAFTEALEEDCANMYHWYLGAPDTDNNDILAVVFTTTDLSGAKDINEAAALVTANGKPTLHLQAQVHGSEQSATEGALGIMKTLAGTYGEDALEKINVVVMPRLNTKGSKDYTYGPKDGGATGTGVDINLDYYKMVDSLGRTQAIVNVYNQFQPEVVIDLHECRYSYGSTSGRQGDLKMATLENLNIPQQIHDLQSIYFAEIFDLAGENGIYGDYYREDPPNNKPVSGRGNYFTRGCVSILLEIPGQRSGKMFWDRRIFAQYIGVRAILDYTVENAAAVQEAVASAREDIIEAGTYFDPENNLITLYHEAGSKTQTYPMPTVDFTTGEYKDATATRSVDKYDKAALTRPRPLAYVVSKDSANIDTVLQICDWQNVKYEEIGPDRVLELKQYGGTAWKNGVSTSKESGTTLGEAKLMSFPNGAYLFPMNQVSGVVLSLLMEPDVVDTRDDASPCSFSQQGVLTNAEIYRCEDLSTHELTYVPAAAADCDTDGCTEHWICECGKGFASDEHANELEADSWVIPMTGHNFVQQMVGGEAQFVCTNNCGEANVSLNKVLAACDGVGGTVKVFGDITTASMVVPAGVTLDLDGHKLTAENLTVNEGGKVVNGSLSVSTTATVNLGSNGGYVPVPAGENTYKLYPIETKVGQQYALLDNGVKYAFGYKYADYAAYAASAAASESGLKFGVALDLDTASADYSFTSDSVAKMTEVTDASDSFYRVNLSIVGDGAEDVTVTPYVKLIDLGFRYEGESFTMPKTPVAEYAGVTYTRLEDAIAEAEKVGSFAEVYLIDDITYHTPTTIKLAGTVRLRTQDNADITISGPVTLDGQNKDAVCVLFRVSEQSKLTLDGVSIKNYKNIWTESGTSNQYGGVGRIEDESTFVMKNCTIENCSGPMRGAFYITGTSTVNIEDCAFVNNTASTQYGGALAIYSTNGVTVKNTTFTNNASVGSDPEYNFGGAIHLRGGALTLDGCSFEGNSALLGDDISTGSKDGSVTLKGVTKMSEIYLSSGKSVTLGSSFALAEGADPIVVDGAPDTTVLTGSIVSTAYTSFAALDEGYVINEAGKIVAESSGEEPPVTPPEDDQTTGFSVNGTAYTTLEDAVAAATSAAASAPVTVTLYEDGNITEAMTIGGANKITFKLADNATSDVKITFSTSAAKFITGGDLEFIGGGTNESAPKLILDGGGSAINHTSGTQILEANGYEMSLKNGVIVQNYYSTNNYSAPIRVRLEGTVTMDGVTIQNNSAKSGAMYAGNHGNINITNSKILNNTSTGSGGGAIYLAYNTSDITVTNTTFSGNTSGTTTTNGVALTVQTGGTNTTTGKTTSCTVTGCTFTGNVCNKAAGVVSLYKSGTVVTMTDCTFADNSGNAFSIVSGATLTHSGVTVNGSAYTG